MCSNLENIPNSLLPSPFLPSRAQLALAAGIVGRCVYVCVCETQVARLDQMQASGGTAVIAPCLHFSLPPFTLTACVCFCVCACTQTCLDVGVCMSLSDLG